MTENSYDALGRTPAPKRPKPPKPTQNAPRGQPGASKLINGVWLYLPARQNEGGESYPPEVYASDLLALLHEETEKWGDGHRINQAEWVQYTVDKYRDYWGPADLALSHGRPRWQWELRHAKIKLSRLGKIITGRERIKNKWYGWMSLPMETETQG